MQSVSQATEIVHYVTGTPRGRAIQLARALIDAGILPKSAGKDIKKVGATKLLSLLAAVAMADKVADAARVAREFETLPLEGDIGKATLADRFGVLMEPVWKVSQIEFHKQDSGYAATIRGTIRKDVDEYVDVNWPFWRHKSWGGFCQSSFTISNGGVEVLRNLFARDDIDGLSFSLIPDSARPAMTTKGESDTNE
jgi:hypothetical protein